MKKIKHTIVKHIIPEYNCDLCFRKGVMSFAITDSAIFHSCFEHAKDLSDIIYPLGDKLGSIKLANINRKLVV